MTDRGTPGPTGSPTAQVRVWDIFVHFSHWTVAAAFFIAFLTEDDVLTLHVWAGYTVGILVVLRVLWGFVGPSHARFMDFVYRPATVWRYAVNLLAFRARRYVGHSPAGGAIVVTLLLGFSPPCGRGWSSTRSSAAPGRWPAPGP